MTGTKKDGPTGQTVLEQIAAAVEATPLNECSLESSPMKPGEEIVGSASDYIKKFYTYTRQQDLKCRLLAEHHNKLGAAINAYFPGGDEGIRISVDSIGVLARIDWKKVLAQAVEMERLADEAQLAKYRTETLFELFWEEVRTSLNIKKSYSIGIRDGWIVVKIAETVTKSGTSKQGLAKLLARLGVGGLSDAA